VFRRSVVSFGRFNVKKDGRLTRSDSATIRHPTARAAKTLSRIGVAGHRNENIALEK
jgi:hypothetical protein